MRREMKWKIGQERLDTSRLKFVTSHTTTLLASERDHRSRLSGIARRALSFD
jgi:hypothetical protein